MKNITLILLLLLSLHSCKKKDVEPIKTVVIFYDLSSSAANGSREIYLTETKKILADLEPGDILIAEAITDKSIREKAEICKITLPVKNITSTNKFKKDKQEADFEKVFESAKQEAANKISKALNNTALVFESTDILSATVLAENIFKNYPGDKNVLVFMSDMIESSAAYNFYKEKLDAARITKIIEQCKTKNTLPQLTNTCVYVSGADATTNANYNDIQQFWISYFTATGAICAEEHYGASLIKFDE